MADTGTVGREGRRRVTIIYGVQGTSESEEFKQHSERVFTGRGNKDDGDTANNERYAYRERVE
ncbi:MAG: hypothetical protein BWY95_02246 [Bacteroidetes bacterium ADurb.BinA104]|nr:MAG: hypothetical protein BWY95_02246 [Bacteroidetes bacterium ADurb.BinA104]